MTPDKIFLVKPLCASEQDYTFISDVELPHYLNTCYIRKDALMEKLEKVAASYKKRSDEGELVWQNMCGINEAINILTEM